MLISQLAKRVTDVRVSGIRVACGMAERRMTIHEPATNVPVLADTDVLVAGGGVAGCAAAYAAARAGAATILVERNGCLGGVATATYMANIGNRMMTGDGRRVIRGFAAEVIDRMVACGAASALWEDPLVSGCVIDSERLKVVLIEMLQEAGVRVFTHAPVRFSKVHTSMRQIVSPCLPL